MRTKNDHVNIVIVTSGGMNSRRLAHLFSINNIPYTLLTVSFPLPKNNKNAPIKYYRKYIKGILSNISIFRSIKMRNLPKYPVKDNFVGRLNGIKMLKTLKSLSPDYIFMMGGGILKDNIINTAKIGVLNAHPGILPYVRGVDAVKHSILNNIPIGVTGHFIDAGIDTGALIECFWLPIHKDDTIDDVVKLSDDLSVAVMFKLALNILHMKKLKSVKQDKRYPLCRKLSEAKSKEAIDKFNLQWYKTHEQKINEMNDISSGKVLLNEYNIWWGKSKKI